MTLQETIFTYGIENVTLELSEAMEKEVCAGYGNVVTLKKYFSNDDYSANHHVYKIILVSNFSIRYATKGYFMYMFEVENAIKKGLCKICVNTPVEKRKSTFLSRLFSK